ncbi:MAG: DUF58 domain-containing protein [Thermoplasmatota archaeon]
MKPRTRRTTPFGRAVVGSGASAIAAGLALGNFLYLLCGAFLIGAVLLSRPRVEPTPAVVRKVPDGAVRPGDAVRVERSVTVPAPAIVWDALPDPFAIATEAPVPTTPNAAGPAPAGGGVRKHGTAPTSSTSPSASTAGTRTAPGSNIAAADAGTHDLSYSVIPRRRGPHELPPTQVFLLDPLGASEPRAFEVGEATDLLVEANAGRLGRLRAPRAHGRSQYAEGDRALRGPRTDEFRELREYRMGDPLKAVNWKASARLSTGDNLVLFVNEYEPEGKKAVWLFLDTSTATAQGTTARTLLDTLVEGALSAADHYLSRGHRVGLATYGADPILIYPDHGHEQYRRLSTALTYVEPKGASDLLGAVEASRGFLAREKPLVVLFSSLSDAGEADALARAQTYAASGRYPAPAILVQALPPPPENHDDITDRFASATGFALSRAFSARGARVLRWDPSQVPLAAVLATGAR